MSLFKLKGSLNTRTNLLLTVLGFAFFLAIWILLTLGENPLVPSGILPKPWNVLLAFGELYTENELLRNLCYSLGLNIAGYIEAVLLAIPIGFVTGLFPFFRGTFQRQIDAFRFVPLTAVTGIFIMWFGLGTDMKVHFLAFGILIYLLPVVVQRIDEIDEVYYKTVFTLGANTWQIIRTVYIPAALSRLSDDIRVLTAISWTYIIIAEGLGSQGGIGRLIWLVGERASRSDKVFALLILIIIIGFLQDKLFVYLDREFFPHKYARDAHGKNNKKKSTADLILNYFWNNLLWVSLAGYVVLFINEFFLFLSGGRILSGLFGDTTWVIHLLIGVILFYKVRKLALRRRLTTPLTAQNA
jgi:NitT/TauT family transport system permease protein